MLNLNLNPFLSCGKSPTVNIWILYSVSIVRGVSTVQIYPEDLLCRIQNRIQLMNVSRAAPLEKQKAEGCVLSREEKMNLRKCCPFKKILDTPLPIAIATTPQPQGIIYGGLPGLTLQWRCYVDANCCICTPFGHII